MWFEQTIRTELFVNSNIVEFEIEKNYVSISLVEFRGENKLNLRAELNYSKT
jgi:hypothetical protein